MALLRRNGYNSACLLVVCSFTHKTACFSAPDDYDLRTGKLVLAGYPDAPLQGNAFFLRPYECRVYLWEG